MVVELPWLAPRTRIGGGDQDSLNSSNGATYIKATRSICRVVAKTTFLQALLR